MTEHLVISTIVLAIILAATRLVPLTARTRALLLILGIVKFAIPAPLFRFAAPEAVAMPMRVLGATAAATTIEKTATQVPWLPIVWGVIAALLFARWLLLRTRTVSAALRSPEPASAREVDCVRKARKDIGVRVAIDAVRSPICEAPAVLRVVRPVIVLPSHGCDALDDDELRAVVLHECAHVARHDNVGTLLQALATSLLWFHPLVWLASRDLSIAREQACDERVADAMHDTDAYVSALSKICHAIAAPRTAGASCMASANLKERLEHLMSYGSMEWKTLSHRTALISCMVIIAATLVAGEKHAASGRYSLKYDVNRAGDLVRFDLRVLDDQIVVAERSVTVAPNQKGEVRWNEGSRDFHIEAQGTPQRGEIELTIMDGGELLHHTQTKYSETSYNGDPISINLRNADVHDVMKTFAQLTGMNITVDPGIEAGVTMNVTNMPWDEALDTIARDHDLVIKIEGKTIRVSRKN